MRQRKRKLHDPARNETVSTAPERVSGALNANAIRRSSRKFYLKLVVARVFC